MKESHSFVFFLLIIQSDWIRFEISFSFDFISFNFGNILWVANTSFSVSSSSMNAKENFFWNPRAVSSLTKKLKPMTSPPTMLSQKTIESFSSGVSQLNNLTPIYEQCYPNSYFIISSNKRLIPHIIIYFLTLPIWLTFAASSSH